MVGAALPADCPGDVLGLLPGSFTVVSTIARASVAYNTPADTDSQTVSCVFSSVDHEARYLFLRAVMVSARCAMRSCKLEPRETQRSAAWSAGSELFCTPSASLDVRAAGGQLGVRVEATGTPSR